jgi:hypothetical protein
MVEIRVGFKTYHHFELGFDEGFVWPTSEHESHQLYVFVLRRYGEPIVATSDREVLFAEKFAHAETPGYDYATLPFRRMIKILEEQQELFMEKVAEAINSEHGEICCSAVNYVKDIIGVLRFSLQRRAVDVTIDTERCWPVITPRKLAEIEEAIEEAKKPAPSLGNWTFIEIAWRAYQLLRGAVNLLHLVPTKGGCLCSC